MKIVHLSWGFGVGGSEAMLTDIASEQAAHHEVWILIGNRDIAPSIVAQVGPSVHLVELGRPPGSRNPWYLLKLLFLLWRIRPDVLHAHQESFIRFKRWLPAPLLLTIHNTRLPLTDRIAGFAAVICISESVKADVLARGLPCRPQVIRNGIRFNSVRVKMQYGTRAFRVVQVSRLAHEQKGQDVLIRALALVKARLGSGSICLDLIGDGQSLGFLRALAAACGLAEDIRFLGVRSRESIYETLHEYDLLVQPSRYEGFGLTVVEGLAARVPVLVSDIEGPMEIIEHGRLGWSFASEDVSDLANRILEVIERSQGAEFPAEMRARAERARKSFDVELVARRYLAEYERLGSGTSRVAPQPAPGA